MAELQQELMNVVRSLGIDSKEYLRVVAEIENLRGRRVGLKSAEAEGGWRKSKMDEFKAYLDARNGELLDKFDEELFRRLIEKVKVQSMVEVVCVFKAGIEVKEIL